MAGNSGKIRCADVQPDLYGGPYSLMVYGQEWARFENAEPVATGDTKVDGLQFAHHECGKLFNERHLHLPIGSPCFPERNALDVEAVQQDHTR